MQCETCQHELSPTTRFCTQCGSPSTTDEPTQSTAAAPTGTVTRQQRRAAARGGTDAGATALLEVPPAVAPPARGPRSSRVREIADDTRRWWRAAGLELRLAVAGTAIVLLSFFLLPFADQVGTAAELGGRVWWRPITAVTATLLIALALRAGTSSAGAQARIVSALALATAGATEAGLLGLVTGNGRGLRVGYHLLLVGMCVVLLAAFLATRHPVRDGDRTVR